MATAAIASLDFLLRHPNALLAPSDTPRPCDRLYVPQFYLRHLPYAPREEYAQFGSGVQTLLRNFAHIVEQLNSDLTQPFASPNGLYVCFFQPGSADDTIADSDHVTDSHPVARHDSADGNPLQQTIFAAKQLSLNYPHIPIITYDPALSTLAALSGIPTVRPEPPSLYTGRRRVTLAPDALERLADSENQPVALTTWRQQIDPNSASLHPNEFIEISNPPPDGYILPPESDQIPPDDETPPKTFATFRRFNATASTIIPLKYQSFAHPKCAEIRPRSAGQRFLMEALLAPADEIPIVIIQGEFGTGKTFLSIAAGYDGVLTKRYSSIVVCPRDSRLGDDIGALPGDTAEKTRSKALGFTDNLYQVIKIAEKIPITPKAHSTAKGKMEEFINESVEFVPLVEMGGRSLSERFIIYDEAQDMTPSQARAIVTRLGDRSKMVIMGDLSQVNNPHLSRTHNGLHYLLARLAGKSPGIAVVNLGPDEILRHPLLREIASYL